jgi:hypothetical protein
VVSRSLYVLGVSAVPLVAFYNIHERKGMVLFFCSVPDTSREVTKPFCTIVSTHLENANNKEFLGIFHYNFVEIIIFTLYSKVALKTNLSYNTQVINPVYVGGK